MKHGYLSSIPSFEFQLPSLISWDTPHKSCCCKPLPGGSARPLARQLRANDVNRWRGCLVRRKAKRWVKSRRRCFDSQSSQVCERTNMPVLLLARLRNEFRRHNQSLCFGLNSRWLCVWKIKGLNQINHNVAERIKPRVISFSKSLLFVLHFQF